MYNYCVHYSIDHFRRRDTAQQGMATFRYDDVSTVSTEKTASGEILFDIY